MEASEITFSSEEKKPLKIGNTEYFSAYDFSLTEKEIEKARKELDETEEKKIRKLQELRDKLASDKDVTYRTDTAYLLRFLRVRKYDVNKAYQNLKEGNNLKKKHHESFRVFENLDQLLNRCICIPLPYTDEEGKLLFYLDIGKWNCQEVSFNDMVQILTAICEVMSMNPKGQVNGIIPIWDMKGLTTEHFKTCIRNWGLREFAFALQVVVLGSDLKELHQHVNPALLPENLGGYLDEKQYNWVQNIIDNVPYLKYDRSFI